MWSVDKVVLLNKLFLSDSTSCEWSQCSISCNIQIDSFIKHHAKIFGSVCVGELRTIKVKWGKLSDLELKHITSDFNVLTVNDFRA